MTETHVGYSSERAAHAVSLKTTHAYGFVAAGADKRWTLFDDCRAEMRDVFTVSSAKARTADTSRGRISPPT